MFESFLLASLTVPALMGAQELVRWFRSDERQALRALQATPLTRIARFPQGSVGRIVGVVEPHEGRLLRAPLTGRECVAYFFTVEEFYGKNWHPLVHEFATVPFLLADGSGRALVQADGRPAWIDLDRHGGGRARPLGALAERLLSSRGMMAQPRCFRWSEGALRAGDRAAALGRGHHTPEPLEGVQVPGHYRRSSGHLVVTDRADGSLPISTDPRTLR